MTEMKGAHGQPEWISELDSLTTEELFAQLADRPSRELMEHMARSLSTLRAQLEGVSHKLRMLCSGLPESAFHPPAEITPVDRRMSEVAERRLQRMLADPEKAVAQQIGVLDKRVVREVEQIASALLALANRLPE